MFKPTAGKIIIAIVLLALFLRLPGFFSALAYDEIWTLLNFAPLNMFQLLFDLELPNNHPLNSLAVKLITNLPMALPLEFIRTFSLLAGMGSIVLAGAVARSSGGKNAMLWSMFFMAGAAALSVYSVQARGYSLQIFFLLLYVYGVIASEQPESAEHPLKNTAMIVVGALGAVVSVSVSVLFLAAVTLLLWSCKAWKLPARRTGIGVIIGALAALIYLLLNIKGLLAARSWGEEINSAAEYFSWLGDTFFRVLLPGCLPFAVCFFVKQKKMQLLGHAIFWLLIAGSALLTNGGPHRVYLPLTAYWAVIGGIGGAGAMERISDAKRQLAALGVIFLTLASSYCLEMPFWKIRDYYPVHNFSCKLPASTLVVYPASETYPLIFNTGGEAAARYAESLRDSSSYRKLLLINASESISGSDSGHNQRNMEFFAGRKQLVSSFESMEYDLERVYWPLPGKEYIIAVIPPCSTLETVQSFREKLISQTDSSKVLLLNLWFNNASLPDGGNAYCAAFVLAPGAVKADGKEPDNCIFYRVVKP